MDRAGLKARRAEPFFPSWGGARGKKKQLKAARRIFKETIDALLDLGSDPDDDSLREVFQSCIESFNDLDEEEQFIDTVVGHSERPFVAAIQRSTMRSRTPSGTWP